MIGSVCTNRRYQVGTLKSQKLVLQHEKPKVSTFKAWGVVLEEGSC